MYRYVSKRGKNRKQIIKRKCSSVIIFEKMRILQAFQVIDINELDTHLLSIELIRDITGHY
jgi:hypothetical protein